MTTETNITGTWTATEGKTGWIEFTVWGSGAGGGSEGGGGGSSGCRATVKVFAELNDEFVITRGAVGLSGANGNHSQVTRDAIVLVKAAGGITAVGAVGGVSVTTGSVGDTITVGGNGTAYNAGTDTGGTGGSAPGGGAGGAGQLQDDGLPGTAPGGGAGGGAAGCIGSSGGLGRVNVEYPVEAPPSDGFGIGMGFGSILGASCDS